MRGKHTPTRSIKAMRREARDNPPIEPEISLDYERPKTRADCASVPRPCPFVGCRHNLLMDISIHGSLQLYSHQSDASCALDEAERGGMTLTEVGEVLDITRERTRQIECAALRKLAAHCIDPNKPPDI